MTKPTRGVCCQCVLNDKHAVMGSLICSLDQAFDVRRLVVGPLTAWFRVSLAPDMLQASISSNFKVGWLLLPCLWPIVLLGRYRKRFCSVSSLTSTPRQKINSCNCALELPQNNPAQLYHSHHCGTRPLNKRVRVCLSDKCAVTGQYIVGSMSERPKPVIGQ